MKRLLYILIILFAFNQVNGQQVRRVKEASKMTAVTDTSDVDKTAGKMYVYDDKYWVGHGTGLRQMSTGVSASGVYVEIEDSTAANKGYYVTFKAHDDSMDAHITKIEKRIIRADSTAPNEGHYATFKALDDTADAHITKIEAKADQQRVIDLVARGAGLWFDGSNDYVNVTDDANIDFGTGDFSLEIHFKPDNVTDANQFLINKEAGGIGYGLEMRTDDLWIRLDDNTADATAIIGSAVFTADTWVHVVVTFDRDGNATAYINGKPTGTLVDISGSPLTLSSAGDLRIGTETGAETKPFSGTIDFTHVWSCLLTAAEVEALPAGVPYKYLGASQTEKVSNGTMEANITGWTYLPGDETATFVYNNTNPITGAGDGKLVVTIVGTSSSTPRLYPTMTTAVEVGKMYRLTFKTKENSGTPILRFVHIGGEDISFLTSLSGTETHTAEMTKPATTTTPPNIYFDGRELFDIQIDDYSLVQIGCVAQYEPDGIGDGDGKLWRDASGNDNHGAISGAIRTNPVVREDARFGGTVTYIPNALSNAGTSVADDGAITVISKVMRVVGADAEAILDTDPAINDGDYDGQIVILQGTADANLITIHDNVNTQLDGGVNMSLGDGDIISLMWDEHFSMWLELYRSDN